MLSYFRCFCFYHPMKKLRMNYVVDTRETDRNSRTPVNCTTAANAAKSVTADI